MRCEIINVIHWNTGAIVAIGVMNGLITHIGERQGWMVAFDGKGSCIAMPPRVDPHVHDRTPGQSYKEDMRTVQRAAIAGGTLVIARMPNSNPSTSTLDLLGKESARISKAVLDYFTWYGATTQNHNDIKELKRFDRCTGLKLTMANTTATGEMLVDRLEDQRRILGISSDRGLLTSVHSENEAMLERNLRRLRDEKIRLGLEDHCKIRNREVEISAVLQILDLAVKLGARVNFCHITTPQAAHAIIDAYKKGARVTFEVCIQNCFLTSDLLSRDDGWRFKYNPGLRSPEDTKEMLEIICDPSIENVYVATDHAPHTIAEKCRGEYHEIPSGMPGLDTCLPLLLGLVHAGKMSMERLIHLAVIKPREILGLDRERIFVPGAYADLIVVSLNHEVEFRDEDMLTKCGWTPFCGMKTYGRVEFAIRRGNILLRPTTSL